MLRGMTQLHFTPRERSLGLLLGLLALLFSSCGGGRLGSGVVLWSSDEAVVASGTLVWIQDESRLQKNFTLENPAGGPRFTQDQWRVRRFDSDAEARDFAAAMAPYRHTFAISQRVGLPMRSRADNAADRIYKLNSGQKSKVIWASPEEVQVGNLSGRWYQLLTEDGYIGFTFGQLLTIIEQIPGQEIVTLNAPAADPRMDLLLSRVWFPLEFRDLIRAGTIDLSRMQERFGFQVFPDENLARLVLANRDLSFTFTEINDVGFNTYNFEGTDLRVRFDAENAISVIYLFRNQEEVRPFVLLDEELSQVLSAEKNRRAGLFAEFYGRGRIWSSPAYGTLVFQRDGSFRWDGYDRLVPTILPESVTGSGVLDFDLFLAPALRGTYEGAFTFRFGLSETSPRAAFLYNRRGDGVQLLPVDPRDLRDSTVLAGPRVPLSLFFSQSAE